MMTRMPSAVAASVRMTVRITPTRAATRPQRNLPAAPPTKSRPSAVPMPAAVVGFRDQRRRERMLDTGAQPGGQQYHEQGQEAAGPPRRDETERGDGGAAHQQAALAPPLGQEAGRYLEERHTARVRGPDHADLGEAQPELIRPQRKEDVEDVGKAVVHEV